jgi:hypothetical protein
LIEYKTEVVQVSATQIEFLMPSFEMIARDEPESALAEEEVTIFFEYGTDCWSYNYYCAEAEKCIFTYKRSVTAKLHSIIPHVTAISDREIILYFVPYSSNDNIAEIDLIHNEVNLNLKLKLKLLLIFKTG